MQQQPPSLAQRPEGGGRVRGRPEGGGRGAVPSVAVPAPHTLSGPHVTLTHTLSGPRVTLTQGAAAPKSFPYKSAVYQTPIQYHTTVLN